MNRRPGNAPQSLDLGDPHVSFLPGALNIALIPDAPHPMYATRPDCTKKQGSCIRISERVRENLPDPDRANLSLLEDVGVVYDRVIRRLAGCYRPPYMAPPPASELYDM